MPISLGVARGKISIDTSDVSKARVSVEQESRKISTSLKNAGEGADFNKFFEESTAALKKTGAEAQKTSKNVKIVGDEAQKTGNKLRNAFDSKNLDNFAQKLKSAGQAFAPISVGAGIVAGFGFKAASSVEQMNIRFKSLAGNQVRAESLMQKIANRARELNLPIQATQVAFAGLIPTIGTSQEAINKYIGLATRVASLNPAEGIQGSIFSIREAVSSGGQDLISLAERFNLPKKRLRELVEQTGDFAKALDIVLTEMGATEESAKAFGRSGTGAFDRATDAANRLLAAGFGPFLEAAVPLLEQLVTTLEQIGQQNPGLLQVAAGFTLILAGVTPVLLAANSLVSAFSTLSKLQVAKNIAGGLQGLGGQIVAGKGLGKAVGTGLAVAGGVEVGVAASRGLAQLGIGDSRLKDATQDEAKALLVERLKQFAVIAVSTVADFIKGFVKVLALIAIAFEAVAKVFEYGATYLKEGFGRLVEVIGGAVIALAEFVSKIPGLEQQALSFLTAGANLQASGNTIQSEAVTRRTQLGQDLSGQGLATRVAEVFSGIDAAIDPVRDKLTKGLAEFLFPPEAEEKLSESAKRFQDASAAAGISIANGISDILDQVKNGVAGFLDRGIKSVSFNDDQIKAFSDFQDDQKAIREKADADELDARKDHRDNLQKIDEKADADIEAIHDRAKERAAADEQAIVDKRAEIADAAKERVAADEQALQDKRAEIAANTKDQLAEEETSYQKNRQKIVADAQKADLQLTKQYNDDLLALIRDRREAASNLDARAVGRINERKDELVTKLGEDRAANRKKAEDELAAADQQHLERVAQIRAAGSKELAEFIAQQAKKEQAQAVADEKELTKLIEKQQQQQKLQAVADEADIARINAKRGQEKQAEEAAYVSRLNQIAAQANRELQLREAAFAKQFNQLAGAENAKLAIAGQGQAAMEAQLRNWYNRQTAILAGQAPVTSRSAPPAAGPRPGFGTGSGSFAAGTPRIARDMVATVHQDEGIMSPPVAAMARSMLGNNYTQPQLGSLLAGRQSAAGALALNWSGDVAIYDAGNRSDTEIKGLVEEGLTDGFLRLHAQLTGGKS